MKRHITLSMTLLALGLASASTALAQNGQAPQQATPQIQQGNLQQGSVQQNTTIASGVQTQVSGTVVEGGIGLSDIAIGLGQQFNCNHVINLLARRRHHLQFGGGIIKPAPIVHYGPYGDQIVQPVLSDLELVSVGLVQPGDADHAPIYGITIANHGQVDLCHFKISAVAALCQIHEFSPTTTVTVDKICPGESLTVEVQMPFASLAMGNCGHRNPFDTLVVAIDAFDQIAECNEINNILILKRTAITVIEAKTETTVEETTTESTVTAPTGPATVENGQAAPAPSAPAPDQKQASPLDNIEWDNLDLSEKSEATGLLSFESSPF